MAEALGWATRNYSQNNIAKLVCQENSFLCCNLETWGIWNYYCNCALVSNSSRDQKTTVTTVVFRNLSP